MTFVPSDFGIRKVHLAKQEHKRDQDKRCIKRDFLLSSLVMYQERQCDTLHTSKRGDVFENKHVNKRLCKICRIIVNSSGKQKKG